MGTNDRDDRADAHELLREPRGSWPLLAADVRCLRPRYTSTEKLANVFRNLVTGEGGSWTFLTYHARVLLCVAHDPRDAPARHRGPPGRY